mmetsp:Transcript_41330/g.106955  ORF Transcript_41330/g.106955 Transcript_41330/m.106955 type:complete len:250 (+) Transcript_41330:463-1212(+)
MVGPIIGALIRRLATSGADDVEPSVRDSWDSAMASMPTPVMRHLAPPHLAFELELNGAGWQDSPDLDGMDDFNGSITLVGAMATTHRGGLTSLDDGLMIDVDDGFTLPPPAVELDDGLHAMGLARAVDSARSSPLAFGHLPMSRGLQPDIQAPFTIPAATGTGAQVAADDYASTTSSGCSRSSRRRFTLPAHVVKTDLAFPAAAAQSLRVRPSGCQAVRVGRRRIAVRSHRQLASAAPRPKRRCPPCGR